MNRNHKRQKIVTAILFIALGVVLILVSIIVEEKFNAKNSELAPTIPIRLMAHLGIGCFVLGALSILIDMDHWTDYFKSRLAEIVRDKKYLENYSQEQLIELQTDVLKTYFKDNEIGGSDGFLKHYQKNIQEMIGEPFRTNVENDIFIDYKENSNKKLVTIHEEITWVCRKNKGVVQSEIKWVPGEGEFEEVRIICVKLEHEKFKTSHGHKEKIIHFENFEESWKKENNGFEIPLEDVYRIDGLKITLVIEVVNPTEHIYTWRMAYISKGLSIFVHFPKDLELISEIYCLNDNIASILKDQPGHFKFSSNEWVLPNEGIAFQLLPKKEKSATTVS